MSWELPSYVLNIGGSDDPTDDLIRASVSRGASNPLARVAMQGTLTVVLDNTSKTYSPALNPAMRPRTPIRLSMSYEGSGATLFEGFIAGIYPSAGEIAPTHTVIIEAVDAMEQLDRYEGPMALLENTTADAVIAAAASAVFTPTAPAYDPGINRFPFSADRWMVEGGAPTAGTARASEKIADACAADWGHFFIDKNGNPTYYNRHRIAFDATTDLTLNGTMTDLRYQMTMQPLINTARVTCHPRAVGETYEVLGRISQRDAPLIDAGETSEFTVHFRDSANTALSLGGKNVLDLIAGTDLIATDDPAGEGNDVTVYILGSLDRYGDHAEVSLTNTSGAPAYIQRLQVRGIAVRVREPITVNASDATSIGIYGTREFDLDAVLMGTEADARALAEHLVSYYANPQDELPSVTFTANTSPALTEAARDLELFWRVEVTEGQTGVSALAGHVYNIEHSIDAETNRHDVTIALLKAYDYGADPFVIHGPPPTGSLIDGTDVVIY